MKCQFDFTTEYNQFYLYDRGAARNTGSDNFWTKKAFVSRLAVEAGILGINTECYGHVRGELSVLESENKIVDFDEFDHIVESGIEIRSGVLQILDCPNSAVVLEIKIDTGIYCARIYASNLRGFFNDEIEEGDDYYKIEIWPGTMIERKVLKQYVSKL